ncbi:MAG: hypothetical protein WC901_05445 [Candidatus Margulisiibacteriota bacterium]
MLFISPEQIYVLAAVFLLLAAIFLFIVYLGAKMRIEVRQAQKQLKREENIEKYREFIQEKLTQVKNDLSKPVNPK